MEEKGIPGGSVVKKLPAMQKTQVQSLGHKDPPEKGMATQSNTPAWRSPWAEEPGGLQTMGSQGLKHFHFFSLGVRGVSLKFVPLRKKLV